MKTKQLVRFRDEFFVWIFHQYRANEWTKERTTVNRTRTSAVCVNVKYSAVAVTTMTKATTAVDKKERIISTLSTAETDCYLCDIIDKK